MNESFDYSTITRIVFMCGSLAFADASFSGRCRVYCIGLLRRLCGRCLLRYTLRYFALYTSIAPRFSSSLTTVSFCEFSARHCRPRYHVASEIHSSLSYLLKPRTSEPHVANKEFVVCAVKSSAPAHCGRPPKMYFICGLWQCRRFVTSL